MADDVDDEQEPWSLSDELAKHGWKESDHDFDRYADALRDMAANLTANVEDVKRRTIAAVTDQMNTLGKHVFDKLKEFGRAINTQAAVITSVQDDFARLKAGPPELGELPPWAVAFRERLLAEVATIWTNGSTTLAEGLRAEMGNHGMALANIVDTLTEQLRKAFDLLGQQEDAIGKVLSEMQELRAEVAKLKAKNQSGPTN